MMNPIYLLLTVYLGAGILLMLVARPLINRQVKRNVIYGVRTRKTLSDDRIWYDSNEFGGRVLHHAGLLQAIGVLVLFAIPALRASVVGFSLSCSGLILATLFVATGKIFRYIAKL